MADMPEKAAQWARRCIDDGLNPAERFATDPLFEKLRASRYWDADSESPVP
jgi:hypothetical protein